MGFDEGDINEIDEKLIHNVTLISYQSKDTYHLCQNLLKL